MRFVIGTSTDVACVGLGDLTLLPSLKVGSWRDYERTRTDAMAAGSVCLVQTGSDGSFLVHLFVEEQPPAELEPYLFDPIVVERLRVPSGRLRVAGEECFSDPHMAEAIAGAGEDIRIEPGDYHLTAFRSDAGDKLLDVRFREQATAAQRRAWSFENNLSAVCVFATFASVIVGGLVYLRTASITASVIPLFVAAALWLARQAYCRRGAYRSAEKLYRTIELDLPSIAAVLRRLPAAGSEPICRSTR